MLSQFSDQNEALFKVAIQLFMLWMKSKINARKTYLKLKFPKASIYNLSGNTSISSNCGHSLLHRFSLLKIGLKTCAIIHLLLH